jgi:hypothetical protein
MPHDPLPVSDGRTVEETKGDQHGRTRGERPVDDPKQGDGRSHGFVSVDSNGVAAGTSARLGPRFARQSSEKVRAL